MAKRCTHKNPSILRWSISALVVISAAALVFSCAQDPIFAYISSEEEPKDPRIAGTPANIVVASAQSGKAVYAVSTGSKTVHRYKDGAWSTFSAPGSVSALASDNDGANPALYALIGGALRKYDAGSGAWTSIGAGAASGYWLQAIYGAGGKIFAGGREESGGNYGIFYSDGTSLVKLTDTAALLSGAAVDSTTQYFLSTRGSGIYKFDSSWNQDPADAPVTGSDGNVTGIMNLGGQITAVTQNGSVLVYDGSQFNAILTGGPAFTGGMSVWKAWDGSGWRPTLLLLGIHSTGANNKGYREVELDSNGKVFNENVFTPGTRSPSSVSTSNKSEYDASIARYSVHYILQVPVEVENPGDHQPVIFGATTRNGLQSLRNGRWNAEE